MSSNNPPPQQSPDPKEGEVYSDRCRVWVLGIVNLATPSLLTGKRVVGCCDRLVG